MFAGVPWPSTSPTPATPSLSNMGGSTYLKRDDESHRKQKGASNENKGRDRDEMTKQTREGQQNKTREQTNNQQTVAHVATGEQQAMHTLRQGSRQYAKCRGRGGGREAVGRGGRRERRRGAWCAGEPRRPGRAEGRRKRAGGRNTPRWRRVVPEAAARRAHSRRK